MVWLGLTQYQSELSTKEIASFFKKISMNSFIINLTQT